ncbi:MAG: hypothetical protein ABSA86_06825 [Oryzomonas sp.]|jgi:hypothetical protein
MIRDFFSHNFAKIREINQKYAKPNVEMSGWVKASLLFLRLYLILLVGLLLYKFITLL